MRVFCPLKVQTTCIQVNCRVNVPASVIGGTAILLSPDDRRLFNLSNVSFRSRGFTQLTMLPLVNATGIQSLALDLLNPKPPRPFHGPQIRGFSVTGLLLRQALEGVLS